MSRQVLELLKAADQTIDIWKPVFVGHTCKPTQKFFSQIKPHFKMLVVDSCFDGCGIFCVSIH